MKKSRGKGVITRLVAVTILVAFIVGAAGVNAERVRGAYPSANVQFLPAFVALEKGFYKREGLDGELISVRSAVTAVQALLGNQIHFIFSVGPQMPSVWEGADIILLAQMIGRPTFSLLCRVLKSSEQWCFCRLTGLPGGAPPCGRHPAGLR